MKDFWRVLFWRRLNWRMQAFQITEMQAAFPDNVNLIVERTPASAFEPIVCKKLLAALRTRNYRIQMNGVLIDVARFCSSLNQYCSSGREIVFNTFEP